MRPCGGGFVAVYAVLDNLESRLQGNLYMFAAIVVCDPGYAEGAPLISGALLP